MNAVGLEIDLERVRHARFNLNSARAEFREALKELCGEALRTRTACGMPNLTVAPQLDHGVIVAIGIGPRRIELRFADGEFEAWPPELDLL